MPCRRFQAGERAPKTWNTPYERNSKNLPLREVSHVQISDRGEYCLRKRSGIGPGSPKHQRKWIMFTQIAKTLAAAVVLTSSLIALNTNPSPAPGFQQLPTTQEQ